MQKKRERLRSRHFLFLHVSTNKLFCVAEWKAPQERICESDCGKRKGSGCVTGISFSCMFQRANISAQQKSKLCKSGFASLFRFKKGSGYAADISFSCMFQRANISVQQKSKLCKSGFALSFVRSIFRQKTMYSQNLLIEKFRNGF